MTKLIVAGEIEGGSAPSYVERDSTDGLISVKKSISLSALRDGAIEHKIDVEDDDIIELTLSDGRRHWIRADQLESELSEGISRGGQTSTGDIRIPSTLPLGTHQRGVGGWVIKGLKILGVDLAGSLSDLISKRVEVQSAAGQGLFRLDQHNITLLQPVTQLDFGKPILVFLHGTASSTEGSFGDLWSSSKETVSKLFHRYDNQVLALEHRTLTHSPIRNALELMETLVKVHVQSDAAGRASIQLDLISHSRGGLVGEVLCRGTAIARRAFDENDDLLFSDKGYEDDKIALAKLNELMSSIDLKIAKFVRVACPARGTTLAGGRLDRYLSGLVNVVGHTTGLANSVLFDSLSTLMLGVVKQRTQPQEIPGLEAMMPGSPTVKMLNRPDITLAADLHVLGGDIEPSGVLNRLRVFITDLYYQEDHDLVVNSLAMLGGAQRQAKVHYWLHKGPKVNHFLYFTNSRTVSRLEAAMVTDSNAAFDELEEIPARLTPKDYNKRSGEPQPIVFVLPGIMGSHLACAGKRVWLDYIQLARGGVRKLAPTAPDIEPDGPIEDAYGELMEHLAATHDVRPFAYDWRKPIMESAKLLEVQLDLALETAEANDQPVRIVAHSMGGLVFRALLGTDRGKTLWARMCRLSGCRFIMLGTPNRGSHAMASLLIGRDSLMKKLAFLDLRNDYATLQKTVVEFDGVLELLPQDGSIDLFSADDWDRLYEMDTGDRIERPDQRGIFGSKVAGVKSAGIDWQRPGLKKLTNAAKLKQLLLNSPIDPNFMIYIAGTAAATAFDISFDKDAAQGRKVKVSATSDGDGRVPWDSGIPTELKSDHTYYLNVPHGDLAAHRDAFPAIVQLLEEGRTDRISKTPVGQRGVVTTLDPIMLPESVDMYPDRHAILSAALGGRLRERSEHSDKTRVRIIHGNLARSEHPVLVGHYDGDTIVSAEDYLDRQLEGRLRQRHLLGLYPARLGTNAIVLNTRQHQNEGAHAGAIVVGLSTYGDLTPGRASTTIARGLMQYAVTVMEQTRERYSAEKRDLPSVISVPFSALLIGASSDIGVSDSLNATLQAVRQVNKQLRSMARMTDEKSPTRPLAALIDKVDIIELWEDKAVQATRALRTLAARDGLKDHFDIETRLIERDDGCTRVSVNDREGWWQRMRVTADPQGVLQFETFAEQARIDTYLQPTQRKLVDRLLSSAIGSSTHNSSLSRMLFEVLIPNELKEYAPDRRDMVIMLDKASANYPWELLQDGSDANAKPLSVESAMIRQLVTEEFRPQPALAQDQSALVIGDPTGNQSATVFPKLLGARNEAQQVARLLNARGYSPVVELTGDQASALSVMAGLYEQPYKILHIAAHGVFDQAVDEHCEPILPGSAKYALIDDKTPRMSGVVLGEGMYLTPVEIGKMRVVPQLVFINCCHLGSLDDRSAHHVQYNKLAASFAHELIAMGVRGVIAAGWAVDDDAAATFAKVFYQAMLGGERFGQAVWLARSRLYADASRTGSNTWGAYQCYGDPEFALIMKRGSRRSADDAGPVSASELRHDIESLSATVEFSTPSDLKNTQLTLESLLKGIPKSWFESGALCATIAELYAKLGQFEQAVEYYSKAKLQEDGDVPLVALEQLVNMISRSVSNEFLKGGMSGAQKTEAIKNFKNAELTINKLLAIKLTQERLSLKGSMHKRWATVVSKAQQVTQLKKTVDAYAQGYELSAATKSTSAYYPLQNLIAASIALSWCPGLASKDKMSSKKMKNLIAELGSYFAQSTDGTADFWTMCQQPDLQLLSALHNGIISEPEEQDIVRAYLNARQRGAAQKDIRSIKEHITFFITVAKTQMAKGSKRDNVLSALKRISETMEP